MSEPLLAPPFLFRFSAPLKRSERAWTAQGIELPEAHRLPNFGELEGKRTFADLRLGWNEQGIAVWLRVEGKKQTPWCRESRLEDSDGLSLFIDTRDTQTIHRAGRFCHRFVFLPSGAGRRLEEPHAALVPINRAKEPPKPVAPELLFVRSEKRVNGYVLQGFIPAAALTGYDPAEHPKIGFSYAVIDRELGWQTLSLGPEFPFVEDPSLWCTLALAK